MPSCSGVSQEAVSQPGLSSWSLLDWSAQSHGFRQKTGDSWVRDRGLYDSRCSRKPELPVRIRFPCAHSPTGQSRGSPEWVLRTLILGNPSLFKGPQENLLSLAPKADLLIILDSKQSSFLSQKSLPEGDITSAF